MTIRTAELSDVDMLVQFNQAMAQETEGKSLDVSTLRAGVRTLMLDPEKGFYLVAERDDRIAGSLMITTEWSDWRNGTFWWIQSVFVRPEARRKGVYSALYAHVKTQARSTNDVCGIRLYVEKDNSAARTTYENLGMDQTPYRMYEEMI